MVSDIVRWPSGYGLRPCAAAAWECEPSRASSADPHRRSPGNCGAHPPPVSDRMGRPDRFWWAWASSPPACWMLAVTTHSPPPCTGAGPSAASQPAEQGPGVADAGAG